MRRYRRDGTDDLDGHLWSYTPLAIVTPHNVPLLRSRALHRGWGRLTIPNVKRVVRDRGFDEVDLLYIDTPIQRFWLDAISFRASVARIADRYAGFSGIADEVLDLEENLIRSVDLTVFSARSLEAHVLAAGARRAAYLPNGVDFAALADAPREAPREYADLQRPIAVFIGSLDCRFDYKLMDRVALALPDVSFVLVGPDISVGQRLPSRPNIHRLGVRGHRELPRYLHNAEVGLIPYDVISHPVLVGGIHPLKVYEYFACGLPVVASRWAELERIGGPAILCEGPDQFIVGIRRALAGDVDASAGIELARRADWGGRVRDMLGMLGFASDGQPR